MILLARKFPIDCNLIYSSFAKCKTTLYKKDSDKIRDNYQSQKNKRILRKYLG